MASLDELIQQIMQLSSGGGGSHQYGVAPAEADTSTLTQLLATLASQTNQQDWQTGNREDIQNFDIGNREDTQNFQIGNREDTQAYGTAERVGTQKYQAGESALDRALRELMQTQQFGQQTSERQGSETQTRALTEFGQKSGNYTRAQNEIGGLVSSGRAPYGGADEYGKYFAGQDEQTLADLKAGRAPAAMTEALSRGAAESRIRLRSSLGGGAGMAAGTVAGSLAAAAGDRADAATAGQAFQGWKTGTQSALEQRQSLLARLKELQGVSTPGSVGTPSAVKPWGDAVTTAVAPSAVGWGGSPGAPSAPSAPAPSGVTYGGTQPVGVGGTSTPAGVGGAQGAPRRRVGAGWPYA